MNKQVLKLAVPSILANVTIPLVGLVDTAIVGHIADATIIGGIAIGTMLFDLLYWNMGFLRVGTGGITAQAYGRGDWKASPGTISSSGSGRRPPRCRSSCSRAGSSGCRTPCSR